jgi:endonuclease/exonuclease/phosphatase family metal-dependent hydrolase
VWPWHSDNGEYPGDKAWTNWARQAPVIAQQAEDWTRVLAERPGSILCVAGDLNMTFGGPNPYHSKEGRIEAALAMQQHDLVCTTGWARLPHGMLERAPIDHILLPRPIADRTQVSDVWRGRPREPDRLSDHSGVIVEITPAV